MKWLTAPLIGLLLVLIGCGDDGDGQAGGLSSAPEGFLSDAGSMPSPMGGTLFGTVPPQTRVPPPTRTVTPTPPVEVEFIVDTATIAGDAGTVCVTLVTNRHEVAGTLNDLFWDPTCLAPANPCVVNPALDKDLHTRVMGDSELRAILLAIDNLDPIPAGDLYCCRFRIENLRSGECCPVSIGNVQASTPGGVALNTLGRDGAVCVE